MKGQTLTCLVVMLICVTGTEAGAAGGPEAVAIDFTRDIQPLFAKHCLLCHGPDAAQGGLRLHTKAAAGALLESGSHGIVPGDPAASELLARVSSRDPLLQMPPEGDRLTPAETDLLEAWIAQGAAWETHWAYRPLTVSAAPTVHHEQAAATDIDRFVVAKLEAKGLTPSSEADRTTLIRRLFYDLIGLPPEPSEVDAFVADDRAFSLFAIVASIIERPCSTSWLRRSLAGDNTEFFSNRIFSMVS